MSQNLEEFECLNTAHFKGFWELSFPWTWVKFKNILNLKPTPRLEQVYKDNNNILEFRENENKINPFECQLKKLSF